MEARPLRRVLFITADQWRAECLSAAGHPVVRTPNLDRLAAEGVRFSNHFAQCAPCGPARTSLLTGMYLMNHRSGRNGTPLDARHGNLALEARKAGYEPVLFGYTDTSLDPRGRSPADPALTDYGGILPGFSVGCELNENRLDPWLSHLRAKGYVLPDDPFAIYLPQGDFPEAAARGHSFAPPVYGAADSDTAFMADRILDYLELHRGHPWFVHGVFLRPHPPLFAPEPYNSLYDSRQVEGPLRAASMDEEARQHPFLAYWLETQGEAGAYMGHYLNVRDLPAHEIRQMRASYYGLISEVDHHVGRLLDHLKATGAYEETLIVFTVDHGEMLGDHWLFGKGGYFEQSYHIPLIIRDPRPEAHPGRGRVVGRFTEAVDVMPTILEWLGQEIPPQCDGRSLLPFLSGQTPARWRREAHWEYDFRDVPDLGPEQALGLTSDQCTLNVIRDERYKYVHFGALPPLLFDLESDPGELRDLAGDPDNQGQVLEYAQRLLSWRMEYADRALTHMQITPEGLIERRPVRR